MDVTLEQLRAADKVVIGRWWFALVDGVTYAGAVTMGGKVMLDTADTLPRYLAYIHQLPGPADAPQRFMAAIRRASLMLEAVAHPAEEPQRGLNPNALTSAREFAAGLGGMALES